MNPPPSPPPPVDRGALADVRRRSRRRRAIGAAFILATFAGSFAGVWVLETSGVLEGPEWAFTMTQVADLRASGVDGSGQVVCLVDTGIERDHPALRAVPLLGWRDFVNGRTMPYDDDGHGTSMAAILAARGPFEGVAPGVALLVAKVLDAQGRGTSGSLAQAAAFCADPDGDGDPADGASVISLSLVATATDLPVGSDVAAAVNAALRQGIVVVASAGNDGLADDGDVQRPASIPGVLAVGAVDSFGAVARFSSMGSSAGRVDPDRKPELVAPGVDLLSAGRAGTYRLVSGTSTSAAFVAGIVALLLEAHPALAGAGTYAGVAAIKAALTGTAAPGAGQALPHDPRFGYGIVRALAASDILG